MLNYSLIGDNIGFERGIGVVKKKPPYIGK